MDVKDMVMDYGHAMRMQLGAMFKDTNIKSPEGKIVKPDFIFSGIYVTRWRNGSDCREYMGVPYFLVDSPPRNAPGWKECLLMKCRSLSSGQRNSPAGI